MNQRFLNILGIIPGILLSWSNPLIAQTCQPQYALGSAQLHLPCVDWLSDPTTRTVYQADLLLTDPEAFLFKWDTKTLLPAPTTEIGAIFEPISKNLYIPRIDVQTAPTVTLPYQVTLQEDSTGVLSIIQVTPLPATSNHSPVATPISIQVKPNSSYQKLQLTGSDADGDTLAFELMAPSQGDGYTLAYISSNNVLYVMVKPDFRGEIKLPYRVSDGKTFSQPVAVKIAVTDSNGSDEEFFLGSNEISAREFAGMPLLRARSGLSTSSTSQSEADLPSKIDLSAQFPTPGYQGKQNSCVGWSIAYAVKSYEELLENGWSLDTKDHLYSPAFIYNQLNNGQDNGLKVNEALDWVVEHGMATLATMPYQETDYTTQPTIAAIQEAQNYKPQEWGTLKSTQDMKSSLANQQPVIITMAVFNSFKYLKGTDSVYNTADTWIGEHAVTVVGYDDGHASGGAFKVMNSWGTDWGDQGFFWLPYDFSYTQVQIDGQNAGSLISGAFVVVDQANTSSVNIDSSQPPQGIQGDYPNLTVKDLQIKVGYEQLQAGVAGQLQYTVENSGVVAVPAESAWVDLIISQNPNLVRPDYQRDQSQYYFLRNQIIAAELAPGQSVTQTIDSFVIPPTISSGEYNLYLIVDAFDKVNNQPLDETNKDDNIKKVMETPLILFGTGSSSSGTKNLPNLVIRDWKADYDTFQAGAEGELRYTVANTGLGTVPANSVSVGLILSKKPRLSVTDYYYDEFYLLTAEIIDSELATGAARTRDENNVLPFLFPDDLPPAEYYLYLVVETQDNVSNQPITESNYQDNISIAEKVLSAESTTPLPNLITDFWFVEWDRQTGEAKLDYTIENDGVTTAPAGWDMSLVLSSLVRFDSSGKPYEVTLWRKVFNQDLAADFDPAAPENQPSPFHASRDNPEPLNVYKDLNGKAVPPGSYDLILRLDSNNTVKEYDENNDFYSGIRVETPKQLPPPPSGSTPRRKGDIQQAYNGRRLLTTRLNNSSRQRSKAITESKHLFSKTIRSKEQFIFPIEQLTPMPAVNINQK